MSVESERLPLHNGGWVNRSAVLGARSEVFARPCFRPGCGICNQGPGHPGHRTLVLVGGSWETLNGDFDLDTLTQRGNP